MVNILTVLATVALVAFARGTPVPYEETLGDSDIIRADPKVDYRLPAGVTPNAYKIKLTPRLEDKFDFDGEVEIKLTVTATTLEKIVLHAADLTISKIALVDSKNAVVKLKNEKGTIDTTTDFLTVTPDVILAKGDYTLTITYTGSLDHDDLRGFYRSSYVDDYGAKVWLATTHFEPIGARRAFPCFDEPALKATFELSIVHPKKLHAISNMPDKGTLPGPTLNTAITSFEVTPKMSTYLVAFVVSDFESLSNKDGTFNIWARKNSIRHGQFSLEQGQAALKALDTFTGIAYSTHGFKKMDNIAIPQFSAGAMENWGLVTYRESGLLVEEGVTTTSSKEGVATVISHEFAHQWFGNLVGPEWWTYTWLNEGFANYLQYVITNEFLPDWRLKEQQVVKSLQATAFAADAVSTAHEMDWVPSTPADISSKFDSISYHKAGAIIRMTKYVLGEDKFKAALTSYLKVNGVDPKKGVANSDALFKEFKTQYGSPAGVPELTLVLKNWATNPGFPVIDVTRNYETGKVNITQARFLLKADDTQKQTYYVPFNYAQEEKDFKDLAITGWLEPGKPLVDYDAKLKKDQWVVFNKEHFGYYRVNYDKTNWDLLSKQLQSVNFQQIPKINRAQLIDDALNLARVGQLEYKFVLDLIKYLKQEYDYIPWYPAFHGLGFLQRVLASSKIYSNFKTYVVELTENLVKNVTFNEGEKDEHVRKYLRVDALNWACTLGSKSCRDSATTKVSSWLTAPKDNKLSPDTKTTILCAAVRNYNQAAWDKLLQKYLAEEESGVLTALGCNSNTKILKGYLAKVFEEKSTLNHESVITAVYSGSEEGVNVALDFVLENADKIYAVSGNKTDKLKTYVNGIGLRITTQAQLDKLTKSENAHIKEVRASAETAAKDNLEWLKVHEQELITYFTPKKADTDEPDSAVTFTVSSILLVVTLSISQLY